MNKTWVAGIVIAVLLFILLIGIILIMVLMMPSDNGKTFVSGYSGQKYTSNSDDASICELHKGTRELLDQISGARQYKISKVHNYYASFLQNNPNAPHKIRERVEEIVDHTYYELGFAHTSTNDYVIVQDKMKRLMQVTLLYLDSMKAFAEISGDSRASAITRQYEDMNSIDDFDEYAVHNLIQLPGERGDRLLQKMRKEKTEGGHVPDHLYLESITPHGAAYSSTYDNGVQRGILDPFDGDLENIRRYGDFQNDTVENEIYVQDDGVDDEKDLNYPTVAGAHDMERNHVTLTNYRGRELPLVRNKDKCCKKK